MRKTVIIAAGLLNSILAAGGDITPEAARQKAAQFMENRQRSLDSGLRSQVSGLRSQVYSTPTAGGPSTEAARWNWRARCAGCTSST